MQYTFASCPLWCAHQPVTLYWTKGHRWGYAVCRQDDQSRTCYTPSATRPGSRGPRISSRATATGGPSPQACRAVLSKACHPASVLTGTRSPASADRRLPSDPQEVPMTVYIGIDWSQDKHDVCFLNEAGAATPALAAQVQVSRGWYWRIVRRALRGWKPIASSWACHRPSAWSGSRRREVPPEKWTGR